MAEITVTTENFESEVLKSELPVLLDFWAEWCGPCRMLSPVVAEIAEEYDGRIKVGKVNVDEEQELSDKFRVESIPMVVIMKNGKVTNVSVGYKPKEQLTALLDI